MYIKNIPLERGISMDKATEYLVNEIDKDLKDMKECVEKLEEIEKELKEE